MRAVVLMLVALLVVGGAVQANAAKVTVRSAKLGVSKAAACTAATVAVTNGAISGTTDQKAAVVTFPTPAGCAAGLAVTLRLYRANGAALETADVTGAIQAGTTTVTVPTRFQPSQVQGVTMTIGTWGVKTSWAMSPSPATAMWTVQVTDPNGKCLDVRGGTFAEGTAVQIYTCNQTAAQKWTFFTDGTLRTGPNNTWCLTVPGSVAQNNTGLVISACGTGLNQRWTTDPSRTVSPYVQLVTGLTWPADETAGGCADVTGASTDDGTAIIAYICINQHVNQYWRFSTWTAG